MTLYNVLVSRPYLDPPPPPPWEGAVEWSCLSQPRVAAADGLQVNRPKG